MEAFIILLATFLIALRDSFFAEFLGRYHFALVAGLGFSITTALFLLLSKITRVRSHMSLQSSLKINLVTFLMWFCYLMALRYIPASINSMLNFSLGPVFTIFLMQYIFAKNENHLNYKNLICSIGVFSTVAFLIISKTSFNIKLTGILYVSLAAFFTAINNILVKLESNKGVTAKEIMSKRFILLGLSCLIYFLLNQTPSFTFLDSKILYLSLFSILAIALPLWLLTYGISKNNPLMTSLLLSLSPFMLYIVQVVRGFETLDARGLIIIINFLFVVSFMKK